MVKIIFRLCMFAIVATAAMVIITPVLSFNSLLYPPRIDSNYVSQQQVLHNKKLLEGIIDSQAVFIYTPEQLHIPYIDIEFTLSDSVQIRGWMAIDTTRLQSPLLVILPDITEGAINYIPAMKQFCDRGFNVCVINLRGQGNSGGAFYTPGIASVRDVVQLIHELRQLPFINYVALMGNGTGAGIAMKAVADSNTAEVLVLQNTPVSLSKYFRRKAIEEWGDFILPFLPAFLRSYEDRTGLSVEAYDYRKMVKKVRVPHMMVAANFMKKETIDETLEVYHASLHYKKRLYIDAASYQKKTEHQNQKAYYDKIAAFINSSLPSKIQRSRFRKLAENYHPPTDSYFENQCIKSN